MRPTLFHYIATREEFEQYCRELFDFMMKDKMTVRIHKIYPLDQVAQAHQVRIVPTVELIVRSHADCSVGLGRPEIDRKAVDDSLDRTVRHVWQRQACLV